MMRNRAKKRGRPEPIIRRKTRPPTPDEVLGWWLLIACGNDSPELIAEIQQRLPGWCENDAIIDMRYAVAHGKRPLPRVEQLINPPDEHAGWAGIWGGNDPEPGRRPAPRPARKQRRKGAFL